MNKKVKLFFLREDTHTAEYRAKYVHRAVKNVIVFKVVLKIITWLRVSHVLLLTDDKFLALA